MYRQSKSPPVSTQNTNQSMFHLNLGINGFNNHPSINNTNETFISTQQRQQYTPIQPSLPQVTQHLNSTARGRSIRTNMHGAGVVCSKCHCVFHPIHFQLHFQSCKGMIQPYNSFKSSSSSSSSSSPPSSLSPKPSNKKRGPEGPPN